MYTDGVSCVVAKGRCVEETEGSARLVVSGRVFDIAEYVAVRDASQEDLTCVFYAEDRTAGGW